MSILKIALMGHPVLLQPAEPVDDPRSPEIARLVADMVETLEDVRGRGLAAPQVHVSKRVVVFYTSLQEDEDTPEGPETLTVLINPEIEVLTEEDEDGWEGCLSVPSMRGVVRRATRVRYRGVDLTGAPIEREATGHHARVVQHECDHLDGILYPMRMEDLGLLLFESELPHFMAMAAEGAGDAEEA